MFPSLKYAVRLSSETSLFGFCAYASSDSITGELLINPTEEHIPEVIGTPINISKSDSERSCFAFSRLVQKVYSSLSPVFSAYSDPPANHKITKNADIINSPPPRPTLRLINNDNKFVTNSLILGNRG